MTAIVVTALATFLITIVVQNLISAEKVIEHQLDHRCAAGDGEFERLMSSLLGPPLVPGNQVTPLHNGDEIFPAMLAAIRAARRSITFETYIYWSGSIGQEFSDALSERARAGVKVHVMLDWVGSGKMDPELIQAMQTAGVTVVRYHPVHLYSVGRFNNRTHRKLLVVDGRVGFTGGVGIADIWSGNAQDPDHWRDSHYRLEGPAVAQMQAAFMDNWIETTGEVLLGEAYFPALEPVGPHLAQVFKSSVNEGSENVRLMYLLSIASAVRRIQLGNAYFVPDNLTVEALVAARKRGVEVDVILPSKRTDAAIVRWASRSRWGPLLRSGVAMYEFQPTMYHVKIMVIDGVWASLGSTNFDSRSFRLNDEANLNVLDRDFAQSQSEVLDADRAKARRVTLEAWNRRPVLEKVQDWLAGTVRLQL